jgi:hypothetical protein
MLSIMRLMPCQAKKSNLSELLIKSQHSKMMICGLLFAENKLQRHDLSLDMNDLGVVLKH